MPVRPGEFAEPIYVQGDLYKLSCAFIVKA